MKKYLVVLMALTMVLGLTSVAMAQLDTEQIPVKATVAKYAEITCIDGISLSFSGVANEKQSGSDIICVETNTDVMVSVSTTQLTHPSGATIYTYVEINPQTPCVDDGENSTIQAGPSYAEHNVVVAGQTGAISGQPAGDYTATVTVTVSAL